MTPTEKISLKSYFISYSGALFKKILLSYHESEKNNQLFIDLKKIKKNFFFKTKQSKFQVIDN